jgi:hypothetical protein
MVDKMKEEPPYSIAWDADSLKYIAAFEVTILPALKRILDLAKAKNVKVQLVVNPYYPPFADKMINLEDFISKVEKATGMKVHNFSKAIKEEMGFGDYQHLNKYGSRLYIDLLVQDGILN